MANVPDTRTTRCIGNNIDLAPVASDPERILPGTNPSFRTAFANPKMSFDVDNQVETLEQALKSDNEGSPSLLAREPEHSARSTPNLLASVGFCAIVRPVARKHA